MRSSRVLPMLAVVAAAVSSGACTSLSGVGGSSTYSCPLPQGGHCKPISQVYQDSLAPGFGEAPGDPRVGRGAVYSVNSPAIAEASAASDPSQAGVYSVNASQNAPGTPAARAPLPYKAPAAGPDGNGFTIPGLPASLLTRPRVLRVYIAPWADNEDTLLEGRRAYVKLDDGRWRLEHFRKAEQKAYAPIQPPPAAPPAPQGTVEKGADAIAKGLGDSPFMPAAVADRLREREERLQ